MPTDELVIQQTKKWINDVVIGCNFCPFAAKVVKNRSIFFQVEPSTQTTICLEAFVKELTRLSENDTLETSFLIFPNSFTQFASYLEMVSKAEKILKRKKYKGLYQVASFHPGYLFAGSAEEDAANYTNRSVYPMLHLLRESSIESALKQYAHPENIPERNIGFARGKGMVYMKMLRDDCINA